MGKVLRSGNVTLPPEAESHLEDRDQQKGEPHQEDLKKAPLGDEGRVEHQLGLRGETGREVGTIANRSKLIRKLQFGS